MSDWFTTLSGSFHEAWALLEEGARDAASPARFPAFATVNPEGGSDVRTVRLRDVSRKDGRLVIYTDLASDKMVSLSKRAEAALSIWDPSRNFQLRLRTHVSIATGEEVAAHWQAMDGPARLAYGGEPSPGTPLETPESHQRLAKPERLAVLRCTVFQMDTVSLEMPCHRRALFDRSDNFRGRWIAP